MSFDPHKHCQAPKGVSVLMFKSKQLRAFSTYFCSSWPGGFYGTATLLGSRTGAPIAGAWMAMTYKGKTGMKETAKTVIEGVRTFRKAIKDVP